MPDDPTATTADSAAIVDPPNEPDTPELGDAGKKALDKERKARRDAEARVKELEPLAKKAEELEESQKSEAQKAADKAAAAENRAAAAEAKALRYEVAAAKELPAELVEFLTGETEEELEAQADKLLAWATQFEEDEDDDAPPSRQPKENLRPGRKGKEPSVNDDPLLAALKARSGA